MGPRAASKTACGLSVAAALFATGEADVSARDHAARRAELKSGHGPIDTADICIEDDDDDDDDARIDDSDDEHHHRSREVIPDDATAADARGPKPNRDAIMTTQMSHTVRRSERASEIN